MTAPPLQGRHVVVTRSSDQADPFAEALRALGATSILVPSIQSAPALDADALGAAARSLRGARWLGFTSPSGVRYGWPAVEAAWPDGLPDGLGVAAVGPGTAEALAGVGVQPGFLPSESTGDAFAAELPLAAGDRVVLMRSDIARRAIAARLVGRGADLTDAVAYRTLEGATPDVVRRALDASPDAIAFTSPSTVRGFLGALREVADDGGDALLDTAALVAIGPVTADEIRAHGYAPTATADPATIAGLVDTLAHLLA